MLSTFSLLAQAQSLPLGEQLSAWGSTFLGALFVLFFFGFCIFIHELGHFIAARLCGLKVTAFSIGFMTFFRRERKGVEYRVGYLPFGGYCEIPQIDSSSDIPEDSKGNTYEPAAPWKRIVTAFAGPLFNFLFGFALAVPVWLIGYPNEMPNPKMDRIVVRDLIENSPEYRAGLRDGDTITRVDGKDFNGTWGQFLEPIIYHKGQITFDVQRPDGSDTQIVYSPEPNPYQSRLKNEDIAYPFFEPQLLAVCYPIADSPAAKAGLLAGDEIIQLDTGSGPASIQNLTEISHAISLKNSTEPTHPVKLWIRRGSQNLPEPIVVQAERSAFVSYKDLDCEGTQAYPFPTITTVPENDSRFCVGDVILSCDGVSLNTFELAREMLYPLTADSVQKRTITVWRPSEKRILEMTMIPAVAKLYAGKDKYAVDYTVLYTVNGGRGELEDAAFLLASPDLDALRLNRFESGKTLHTPVIFYRDSAYSYADDVAIALKTPYMLGVSFMHMNHPTPWEQFTYMMSSTAKTLRALGTSKSDIHFKNMSGPIGIITVIHKATQQNYIVALNIVILITFSLGLLNLFPFPVLDGGHIVLACCEIVMRRRIPSRYIRPVMTLFVVVLIGFMLFVTFHDARRLIQPYMGEDPAEPFVMSVQS